jgi:hypothetical protein
MRKESGAVADAGKGPPPLSLIYLRVYGFGGGGQCGLLLPVAPRHCLSPGPGASAKAVGAAAAIVATSAKAAINLFFLDKASPPFSPLG